MGNGIGLYSWRGTLHAPVLACPGPCRTHITGIYSVHVHVRACVCACVCMCACVRARVRTWAGGTPPHSPEGACASSQAAPPSGQLCWAPAAPPCHGPPPAPLPPVGTDTACKARAGPQSPPQCPTRRAATLPGLCHAGPPGRDGLHPLPDWQSWPTPEGRLNLILRGLQSRPAAPAECSSPSGGHVL